MKKTFLSAAVLVLLCLSLAGCGNKDAEFKAFTNEFEQVTGEMIAKVDADPTADGVDEAQKFLDGKKAGLKTKWEVIKDVRGVQVGEETRKNFEEGIKRSSEKVTSVMTKIQDPEAAAKFQNLVKDWGEIIDVGKQ